ncbi:11153_t:CDS:10 [Paraglomus brasilianum]|uniref:11153_t:CDS:1 n=1 Tax=Paraglomus brasilianum TaxID=144538 RepID=A0A9N8YZL3_9GLOM|nr:11153_t:CDS:10 [Paraglomus brasilianum]
MPNGNIDTHLKALVLLGISAKTIGSEHRDTNRTATILWDVHSFSQKQLFNSSGAELARSLRAPSQFQCNHSFTAVLAETSLLLQSSKLPSVATRNKKQPIPLVSATRSVIKQELPECIRQAKRLYSLPFITIEDAKDVLKQSPSLQHCNVEDIISRVSAYCSLPPTVSNFSRILDRRSYVTSSSAYRITSYRRLPQLEAEANAYPNDAAKQAEFYKESLRANNPHAVISRFERGKYAEDEECFQAYVTALARTDQADKILPKFLQKLERANAVGGNKTISAPDLVQSIVNGQGKKITVSNGVTSTTSGAKDNPIYVVVEEARGYMFWRALRWMGITFTYAFCILTFLSLALENSGLLKTGASQSEYEPSSQQVVKFSDVHGVDEAKEELEELVEFLKDPSKFTHLGGRLPKGVLLTGPPGTGKTLLARAVAGEAGVPFFFMSGSEFDEMYVGVGARRVRELFAAAKRKAPSIVFIDELDAIGSKRNPKDQIYMKQTLNQLLVDLDGFSQTEGVIFIAATNFPELLDKALVRPGRFDRHVAVPLPDVRGRMQIIRHHLKNVQVGSDVDISVIARGTPGFSGADLANLVNHAAIQASRDGCREVSMKHMEFAKDKILMGAERRSAYITEESKKVTAYHEGGHALVALYTPGAMPLHKATIMPRGASLGMTIQLPEMDKDSFTKKEYLAQLDVCMGGRVAEELVYGKDNVTSGAHNDIVQATKIAKQMVTQFGMSDKVGPVAHQDEDMYQLSAQTKLVIESEIRSLVESAQQRAANVLKTHKDELQRLAEALVIHETLTQEEIELAIKGK